MPVGDNPANESAEEAAPPELDTGSPITYKAKARTDNPFATASSAMRT